MHNQNPGVATIDYVNDGTPTVIVIKSKMTQKPLTDKEISSFNEMHKNMLKNMDGMMDMQNTWPSFNNNLFLK